MNFKTFQFIILLLNIYSCSKKISLEDEMNCSNFLSIPERIERTDINKNFTIEVPKSWKYNLYYDDTQSTIYMADTIKELLQTYIIDVSSKNGELNLDQSFRENMNNQTDLTSIKSNFEKFKQLSSFWNVSKGTKNNFTYHIFNLFIKTSEVTYIEIRTELYGDNNIDERLCESFNFINSLEILK